MRLTRNTTPDGKCKYAIVRLDKLREMESQGQNSFWHDHIRSAFAILEGQRLIEYGEPGSKEECFVIKLKDKNAPAALDAYAQAAVKTDQELSDDVHELFERARRHPSRKQPD